LVPEGLMGEGENGVKVHDSYMLHEETLGVSDHCPVALVLAMDGAK
jgi:hypothetical protein